MFLRTEKSLKEFMRYYPIISALVIVHLVLWLIIDLLQLPIGMRIFQWGAGINPLIQDGQYWRLVTPIFLHHGLMHTLFNSFALVLFGPALETMLGKSKFIIAYLVSGIAGNLLTYLIDPSSFYIYVGASGAIYGLFGIYVYMVVFRKDLIDHANAQIIITIFIIGLIMTFLQPGTNIHAHIFGFIGGFAVARMVLINARPFVPHPVSQTTGYTQFKPVSQRKKRISDRNKQIIFWIVIGILVLLGLMNKF